MIKQIRQVFIELLVFLALLILTIKGFYYAEDVYGSAFYGLTQTYLSKGVLFVLLLVSMLASAMACSYFKPIVQKTSLIKNLLNEKTGSLDLKKLISKKEGLFLAVLAIVFYITYDNITHLNDYSEQAFFLVLTIYNPISTLLTIKRNLKRNNLTFKDFKTKHKVK